MRVLNTSPRQCTVIGTNNHETPGLDIVQCAILVDTNIGIVNLIMNEYAYYGKVIAFIHQDKLNGIPTKWMISQSKSEDN